MISLSVLYIFWDAKILKELGGIPLEGYMNFFRRHTNITDE